MTTEEQQKLEERAMEQFMSGKNLFGKDFNFLAAEGKFLRFQDIYLSYINFFNLNSD